MPSAPAPVPEITIESVSNANPLVVSGRARTFENAVSIRVRDARGDLIAETHTTSTGEMGQHNPYEAQLWITRDPGPRITVEAFEYSAKDGSIRSLAKKSVDFTVPLIEMKLVVPKTDCTEFTAVTRRLPKATAAARLAVEALIANVPAFPKGSAVNSVNLRNGVLTVDFNERLQNVGGSCAATAIRRSVEETLRQFPNVREVVITAGGSRELALQP